MNKKTILTIVLVLLVLLLGGASIYVATQLSTQRPVAPTAPESRPAASEPCISGTECTLNVTAGASACTQAGTGIEVYCCPTGQSIVNGICTAVSWIGSTACTKTAVVSGEAVLVLPNCSDVTGPTAMTLGQSATFSATFSGNVTAGSMFYSKIINNVDQKDFNEFFTSPRTVVNGGELKTLFTPPAVGQYWLRCRAWNDGIAECRPAATVDGPPRYECAGPNSQLLVTVTEPACVPSGTVTCNPDCPTACGTAASTITTCTDNCGAATKACPATSACSVPAVLEGSKTAFKNVTANTPGIYTLSTEMSTVSKGQVYVYTVSLKNTSTVTASSVVIKDSLADMPVTYMDAQSGCTYSAASVEVTCNTSIQPGQTKTLSFRVKAADGLANGTVISNLARVTYPDGSLDLTKDLTSSTVVGCNHTCTTDTECTTGLVCDATTSKCRLSGYLSEEDCTAPAIVQTVVVTAAPTRIVTAAPTTVAVATATPTILPETGIFDLPGIATFGGGLLLAVIGILLAL